MDFQCSECGGCVHADKNPVICFDCMTPTMEPLLTPEMYIAQLEGALAQALEDRERMRAALVRAHDVMREATVEEECVLALDDAVDAMNAIDSALGRPLYWSV